MFSTCSAGAITFGIWQKLCPDRSENLFQSALLEPIVKIRLGRVVATGDKLLGGTICQQALDLGTIRIEFAFPGAGWSSEYHSLRLLEAQGLLSTLRN
jgi:hypothetical protein